MKTMIIFTILLLSSAAAVQSQSVLTLGPGTSMGVLTGADMCTNIINGSGILYGGGTLCGGLVSVEPVVTNELPAGFEMSQNYPNPFNPVSTIKYQMPKANYVTIKLYDQLGRAAGILFEGNQQAGYYLITIDGSNLASGIYFCKINAGDFSKVIKMSLIK